MFLLSDARRPTHEGIRINELPRGDRPAGFFPLGTRPVGFIGFQLNAPLFPEDFYSPPPPLLSLHFVPSCTRVLRISLYYQVIPAFSIGDVVSINRLDRLNGPFTPIEATGSPSSPSRSPGHVSLVDERKRDSSGERK